MSRRPAVVVIGGGVTGTGIARDLAMRGADVTLLERDRLAEGTTGRMHGLLHSGARYAVSDPESARQCLEENAILRDIASHCVEDTGGLFVSLLEDDPRYFEEKQAACEAVGIPTQEVDPETAREVEPALAETVERALLVPDAAVDPFRLVAGNAASATDHGAEIRTGNEVVEILLDEGPDGVTADGVIVEDEEGTETELAADHIINAAGPWVADVVSDLEIDIPVSPSKGAMAVTNSRPVETVINRCRPKGEGDILVPHETTAILGTTDISISDPDSFEETRGEIEFLVEEVAAMVPSVRDTRLIRTYWGVRPLFDPDSAGTDTVGTDPTGSDTTETSRDFAILDHQTRDGIAGLTTVLGGKLTTYRLMAERVSDHVATTLGLEAECRTATEPLPGSRGEVDLHSVMDRFDLRSPIAKRSVDRLGDRTDRVLDSSGPNPVVCECEGVTRSEISAAIENIGPDLGAVRMRTRATMGTCQGGFCSHRLGVLLAREYGSETARSELESLITERWKGQEFVLGGDHLAQVMLNRYVRNVSLNLDEFRRPSQSIPMERFDPGIGYEQSTGSNEDPSSGAGGHPG